MFYIEIYDSYISSEDVPILLILQLQVVRRSFYIPKIETKQQEYDRNVTEMWQKCDQKGQKCDQKIADEKKSDID